MRHAALLRPSANRVYTASAANLIAAELQVLSGAGVLSTALEQIRPVSIAGVPYLAFDSGPLGPEDLAHLGNVSGMFALFGWEGADHGSELHPDQQDAGEHGDGETGEDGGDVLRPLALSRLDRFDDDLLTIQKYRGKTNEQFTQLLLNVALWSSASAGTMLTEPMRVLDPLCGRGTTLNQALMYGYHAAGVDTDAADLQAYWTFLRTWLKDKRLKHQASAGPVRRNKKNLGRRMDVSLGRTKEDFKAGDTREVSLVVADTTAVEQFFTPGSFDVIVTDAPYGVQHGSRTTDLRRSPLDLVRSAVGPWSRLLRRGGALAMSWNTRVAPRPDVAQVLAEAGLEVLTGGPYEEFEHRVDAAITRDVIVARRG